MFWLGTLLKHKSHMLCAICWDSFFNHISSIWTKWEAVMSEYCAIEGYYGGLVTGHLFTSRNAASVPGGAAVHVGQIVEVSCFQACPGWCPSQAVHWERRWTLTCLAVLLPEIFSQNPVIVTCKRLQTISVIFCLFLFQKNPR